MPETYHLVPLEIWSSGDTSGPYLAASLATEGFAHCTDGLGALGETFDRHYGGDAGPFLALTIDLDALDVPWRYDAPGSPYPHVYGAIARAAILAVSRVERDDRGRFGGLATD